MTAHVERLLVEWDGARDRTAPEHLQVVETALFLEDTFRVVVPDALIGPDLLSVDGMRSVLADVRVR